MDRLSPQLCKRGDDLRFVTTMDSGCPLGCFTEQARPREHICLAFAARALAKIPAHGGEVTGPAGAVGAAGVYVRCVATVDGHLSHSSRNSSH